MKKNNKLSLFVFALSSLFFLSLFLSFLLISLPALSFSFCQLLKDQASFPFFLPFFFITFCLSSFLFFTPQGATKLSKFLAFEPWGSQPLLLPSLCPFIGNGELPRVATVFGSVGGRNQLALGTRLGLACRAWARGDVRGWYRWASRQKTRGRVTRWAARQPSMHEELVARGCSFPTWRVAGMHGLLWCGEQCRWRGCLLGMNQRSEGPAGVAAVRWSL